MMSSESQKIKPSPNFQLVLNYSDHCVWKDLKNDSCAGANAASRVDLSLSTTDPLSEIVWSPNEGFSLKCVDSSFADKDKYQDVGPSSMVFALLQSVTGGSSTTDKLTEDVLGKPLAVICPKSDIPSTDTPNVHPKNDSGVIIPDCKSHEENDTGSGGNMEKMNTARGATNFPNDQKDNLVKYCEKNICDQAKVRTAISGQIDQRPDDNLLLQADEPKPSMEQNPAPRKQPDGGMDIGVGNQVVETEDDLYTKVKHIIEYKCSGALGTNLTSPGRSPLGKLESTAENDLLTFNCETTCAATSSVLVSKSNENKNKTQVNEMMLPCDENRPVLHSPCNSKIHMTRNQGKEKSISDEDSNISLSKEENDYHLSVESCPGAGLFSVGKKRCNFQQEVINGSKRVKLQIQETSYAKSYVKQDSSFMNLISNMRRGLSQSTQDEGKSLALTLANPDSHLQWPDQILRTCNKDQDPDLKNAGFKSSFQSINGPSLNNAGTRMSHQVGEASTDFKLGNKAHGIDATPITSCAENSSFYNQHLQSNKFEVSTERHDAYQSLQPKIRPINFLNSHESLKNNSEENQSCYNLGLRKEKEGLALHSSSNRQNKNINVESFNLDERKQTDNIHHKSDTLGGLWITRFLPRSTAPLIVFDNLNERGGSQVYSTGSSMLPHSHELISHLNNSKIEETSEQSADGQLLSEANKLQNCCINKEAYTGLKDDKGNNDHTSKHKFKAITPFPRFRDSEPMVSMFARRLGAIKQIQQTEKIVYHTGKHDLIILLNKRSPTCDFSEIIGNSLGSPKEYNTYGYALLLECL